MGEPIPRLLESPPGSDGQRAGHFLRAADGAPLPSFADFIRIQDALDAAALRKRRLPRRALWVALAALSLGVSVEVGFASDAPSWLRSVRRVLVAAVERPAVVETPLPQPPRRVPSAVAIPPPLPDPPLSPPPLVLAPAPTLAPPTVAPVPPPVPSTTAQEAAALRAIQSQLSEDPAAALAALGDYRRQFPHGLLAPEADAAELSADLALHRDGPALALLDRLAENDFAGGARQGELRLLRAELLSRVGRCGEARGAFSAALGGPLRERALYGLAACEEALGETEGSRAHLERYLDEFPDGRFAAEVRRALGR